MLDIWNSSILEFLLSTIWIFGALVAWWLLDHPSSSNQEEE